MLEEGLSPSRIRQAHVALSLVLQAAVRDGVVARNVASDVRLPKLAREEAPYFDPASVDRIVAAMPEPYDLLVRILGTLGPRWGEAAALRRSSVDLLRRRLRIVESAIAGVAPDPGAPLFVSPGGGPLRHSNFYHRLWRPTLRNLALPEVGLHVLRHSAAARMIGGGAESCPGGARAPLGGLHPDRVRAPLRRRSRRPGRPSRRRHGPRLSEFSRPHRGLSLPARSCPQAETSQESGSELRQRLVGPAGIEPATDGL